MDFSAQGAYKTLVNACLSPGLRERGFIGSAGRYELPTASHFSLLELQKSAFSSSDDLRFTANLFVVRRARWQQETKRLSIAGLEPRAGHFRTDNDQARLGRLASPDDRDDWYGITEHTDLEQLATAVMSDVDSFGIPWMNAMASST